MIQNEDKTKQNTYSVQKLENEAVSSTTECTNTADLESQKSHKVRVNGTKIEGAKVSENNSDRKELKHLVEMPHNDRTIEITKDTDFGSKNKVSRFFLTINYAIVESILWVITKIFYGLKVEGKKNIKQLKKKKEGYIVVSNHFNIMDVPLNVSAFGPHKMQFTSIESNFAIPVAGRILSYFNTIPIPQNPRKLLYVFDYCIKTVKEGNVVHFYPEGILLPYNNKLKCFNKGAFLCAEKSGCSIVPIVFTQRKAKGPFKYLKKYRCSYTAHILPPVEKDSNLSKKEATIELEMRVRDMMVKTIEKYDENVVSIDYSEYM